MAPLSAALLVYGQSNAEHPAKMRGISVSEARGLLILSINSFIRSFSLMVHFTVDARIFQPCDALLEKLGEVARVFCGLGGRELSNGFVFFATQKRTHSDG